MGYLTTITIHNDALHAFKEHPEEFAQAIFDGIDRANRHYTKEDVCFRNYSGYLEVQPSRHADDECLYLHSGNCVTCITGNEFEKSLDAKYEWAMSFLKRAENLMKYIKEYYKNSKIKKQ